MRYRADAQQCLCSFDNRGTRAAKGPDPGFIKATVYSNCSSHYRSVVFELVKVFDITPDRACLESPSGLVRVFPQRVHVIAIGIDVKIADHQIRDTSRRLAVEVSGPPGQRACLNADLGSVADAAHFPAHQARRNREHFSGWRPDNKSGLGFGQGWYQHLARLRQLEQVPKTKSYGGVRLRFQRHCRDLGIAGVLQLGRQRGVL